VTQLKYIFRYLLPNLDGKVLLDIGSRLGAVLYGVCGKDLPMHVQSRYCILVYV